MEIFSAKDRARISRAIARAEKQTSGEIVAVVSASSDDYRFIPVMWAALVALAVPLVMLPMTSWPATHVYALQLAVFTVCAAAVQWWPLRMALVPRRIKRSRAHRHAMEQFLAQNLHSTRGRTGVLIFVSSAERYAEVIADEGIYLKVSPAVWDDVVDELTAHISRGDAVKGFITAAGRCGKVLALHFPPGSHDQNELPNHLIVLD